MDNQEETIFFPDDVEQTGYSKNIFISQNRLAGFSLLGIFMLMLIIAFSRQLLVNPIILGIVILIGLGILAFVFLKFILNEKQIREVLLRNKEIIGSDPSPFWSIHSFDSTKNLLKYYDLTHKAIIRIVSSSKTAQADNFEDFSRKKLGDMLDTLGLRGCNIDLVISSKPYYRDKPFEKMNKLINEENNPTVKAITRYIYKQIQTTARLYADVQVLELEVSSKDQRDVEFLAGLGDYLQQNLDRTLYSNITQLDLEETTEYLATSAGLTGLNFNELNTKNIESTGLSTKNIGWVVKRFDGEGYEIPMDEKEERVIF